ncbi:cell division protein FtsZ [Persicobacter sp. CCB-QB2]|uniref:cell division protein FtsZ n=1 Tax=Persicobacter sp. CCB-QB2 TaxID=1561025 RepID=UPI0006A95764|nr:cell division protein FtsZ [Persicobacter sp. CCB-QB2]
MSDTSYTFDIPVDKSSIIKVIGVGGGGGNAVKYMYNLGINDVDFVVCNTDAQALKNNPVPKKLQIGVNLTAGLGAGAKPERGREAAQENKEEIRELLGEHTKMVFITAGMGGGTGTGAAPVIAQVAREMDILTVGIVTFPFGFEGRSKQRRALEGIEELKEYCDTVIVILNDKLKDIYSNMKVREAFAKADEILTTAAKSIAEIISVHAEVNVDFEDVKTVMKDSRASVMGSAEVHGEDRAIRAAEAAIASPLLNNRDIRGAKRILLSIMSGEDAELDMQELADITEFIQERAGEDAEDVIWGHGVVPELGEKIRVTVIATGFEDKEGEDDSDNNETQLLEAKKKIIDVDSGKTIRTESIASQVNAVQEENTPVPTEPVAHETVIKANPLPTTESVKVAPVSEPTVAPDRESQATSEPIEMEISVKDPVNDFSNPGDYGIPPVPADDEHENNGVVTYDLRDDEKTIEGKRHDISVPDEEEIRKKRRALEEERQRREREMYGHRPVEDEEDYKEMISQPAYLRRKKPLNEVKPSSEENASRFQVSPNNKLLGNNRFLHDNVD